MKIISKPLNLSTKKKMYAGFITVLGIMAIVVTVVLINLLQARNDIEVMTTTIQPATTISLKLSTSLQKAMTELGFYMLSKSEDRKQAYLNQIRQSEKLLHTLSINPEISANEKTRNATENIKQAITELKNTQEDAFVITENYNRNFPASAYSAKNINPLSQKILAYLQIAVNSELEEYSKTPRLEVLNTIHDMRYTWSRVMSELRAFLGFYSKYNLIAIADNLDLFKNLLTSLQTAYTDKLTFEQEEAFADFQDYLTQFNLHIEEVKKIHQSDAWRQDAWLIKTDIGSIVKKINSNLSFLNKQTKKLSTAYAAALTESTRSTIFIVVSLIMIAIIAVITMAWLLTKQIIKPMTNAVDTSLTKINNIMKIMSDDEQKKMSIEKSDDEIENVEKTLTAMTNTLGEIAEEQVARTATLKAKIHSINNIVLQATNGDLTGQLDQFDGTESIDSLAAGIQKMIDNLNTLVTQVQESGIQVTSSSTVIAATAKEHEATVTEQAATTNQIMATATQISATSHELANTMHEVADIADKTTVSANDGQDALASMENTMLQMSDATASITSKLAVLSEKAANINTVVTTITKVADQTNLLSLNAAIEAEKAGEYGLGFAVVATEIRRLADQTAVATWDIEQMVKEMQSAVSAGVMGMDKFSEEVTRGVDEVRQIGSQLAQIIEEVQTLTPRFDAVNEGMQSQSHGAQQISDGMVQLNEATQLSVESLRQSNTSIDKLKQAANALQDGISQFRVQRG